VLRLRGSAAVVLALLLAVSGCGFEGDLPTPPTPPSPPAPPTQAGLTLSLSSSPIEAEISADGSAPWSAEWTLTVQETAGIGGNIDFVRAILADAGGATVAETELDVEQVSEQLGGTNHIRGGSSQQIPMSLSFDFPADTPSANLRVTVQLTDDRGHTVSATVEAVIQVCVPTLLAPEDGAVMDNGCTNQDNGISWEFDWADCAAAQSYEIHLGNPGFEESLDRSDLTSSSFTVLEDRVVPEGSRLGWVWRVRAKVNGVLGNWSPERTFDVEPVNTDCVTP
jgi:hypothetical protein